MTRIWCHGCYRVLPLDAFEPGSKSCRNCSAGDGRLALVGTELDRTPGPDRPRPRAAPLGSAREFRSAELAAIARARQAGVPTEDVDYAAILKRDGYVCQICRGPVEPSELRFAHVVALTRGGAHAAANVSVAHGLCSLRRGARESHRTTES